VLSQALVAGDVAQVISKLNQNAARIDAMGRYSGGCWAITNGLTLSVGGGTLTLAIAAGQAQIDGPVTLSPGTTILVPDNTPRVYVWMNQSGLLISGTSTSPPAASIFLGSCVTSGGAITQVDTSGVVYNRAGVLWRQTADTTTPTDTPPAGVQLMTRGLTESYWWDGNGYWTVASPVNANTSQFAASAQVVIPTNTNLVVTECDTSLGASLTVNGTLRVLGLAP
jgi:hypothetical protein